MSRHGRSVLLLLVAVGAVMGYVSPDDQGRSKSGDRARFEQAAAGQGQGQRQRPQPLSAHDQQRLEQARRGPGPGAGAGARKARDIDTGSGYASSGSASYAGSTGGTGHVSGASFGYPGFQANPFMQNAGNQPFDFNGFFQQLQQIQQSIGQYALNQAADNRYGPGFDSNAAFNQIGNNFEGASATASLGPNGGFGAAQLIPDLGNRFGGQGGEGGQSGQFGPPSGGNVGVFTSSSAGSSDVNGHRQSFKTATSGVNDNGKITTFTVRDPPQ